MFKAKVNVTLRPSILDPNGIAAHHALQNLGLTNIEGVRIGKFIEIDVQASNEEEARGIVESACSKLLANEVMEDFEIQFES
jgi:phosphoribosylformylglycinamidine synthase